MASQTLPVSDQYFLMNYINQSMAPRSSSHTSFDRFEKLPDLVREMIWESFLDSYEDTPPVMWRLGWSIDDSVVADNRRRNPGKHLRIRPYIQFDSLVVDPSDSARDTTLMEIHCNPMLKVNKESRKVALRSRRYASIPVLGVNICVIVRPSIDLFVIESDTLKRLLGTWTKTHGTPETITLTDDMGFVRRVLVSNDDFLRKLSRVNYVSELTSPYHRFDPWLQKMENSVITIFQTYLRNVEAIVVEETQSWTLGYKGSQRISGTHFLPLVYNYERYKKEHKTAKVLLAMNLENEVKHGSFKDNGDGGLRTREMRDEFKQVMKNFRKTRKLGKLTARGWDMNDGPTIDAVVPASRANNNIKTFALNDARRRAGLRRVHPARSNHNLPKRPHGNIAPTIPLEFLRHPEAGRLLKVVGVGDGNFYRERHCYAEADRSGCPDRCDVHTEIIARAAAIGAFDEEYEEKLIRERPIAQCKGDCWVSHYMFHPGNWNFAGAFNQMPTPEESLSTQFGDWDNYYPGEDIRDFHPGVVRVGRTAAVMAWCKAFNKVLDEKEVENIVNITNDPARNFKLTFTGPWEEEQDDEEEDEEEEESDDDSDGSDGSDSDSDCEDEDEEKESDVDMGDAQDSEESSSEEKEGEVDEKEDEPMDLDDDSESSSEDEFNLD